MHSLLALSQNLKKSPGVPNTTAGVQMVKFMRWEQITNLRQSGFNGVAGCMITIIGNFNDDKIFLS